MPPMLNQAARIIKSGGVIIYPTETLYALGCNSRDCNAVDSVFAIKNREVSKPLPVLVGSWEQFFELVEPDEDLLEIVRLFWPGPLSVLARSKGELSPKVRDADGWTSVRFTPHRTAQDICCLSGAPLVATSANLSGRSAPALPEDVDPLVRGRVDLVVDSPPFPEGGLPSTLIRVLSRKTVHVLRPGVIAASAFQTFGITLEKNP